MPISDQTRTEVSATLSAYAEEKVPMRVRDKVRLEHRWHGNAVILFEVRPRFDDPSIWTETPVAKFRYYLSRSEWELYWMDRNLKWRVYDLLPPRKRFGTLLAEVDADPTCIFWG